MIAVIAAHADDEVLGCGATLAWHIAKGDTVHPVFVCDGATARKNASVRRRENQALKAAQILGLEQPVFLGFPDNALDKAPLLEVVQALEKVLANIKPDTVYTHFQGDLNIDHRLVHQATMTACRPLPGQSVRHIFSFETLSSTEWGLENRFSPQCYVDIAEFLDKKMEAAEAYNDEMRDFPHPRSYKALKSLAQLRGSHIGVRAAEAFQVERFLRQ